MSKLPTAEELLYNLGLIDEGLEVRRHPKSGSDYTIKSLMEKFADSHTAAHTAALWSDIKQLQRLLENSIEVGEELRERVKELENELKLSEDTIKHQAERCLKLEAENARYREALEQVIDFIEDDKKFSALSTAKEALKQ